MVQRSPTDIQNRTFDFGVRVIRLVDKLPRTLAATEIGRQLLRSGTSESRSDFIHKMSIALKEARESRYWLSLIDTVIVQNTDEIKILIQESTELTKILFTIITNACKARR